MTKRKKVFSSKESRFSNPLEDTHWTRIDFSRMAGVPGLIMAVDRRTKDGWKAISFEIPYPLNAYYLRDILIMAIKKLEEALP